MTGHIIIHTEGYTRTLGDPDCDPWADDGAVERVQAQLAAEEAAMRPAKDRQRPFGCRPGRDLSGPILEAAEAIESRGETVSFSAVAREMGRSNVAPHCHKLVAAGAWRWPLLKSGRFPNGKGA